MAAIITNVTTDSVGAAVAFAAPTSLFVQGVFGPASVIIEARVPTQEWSLIHSFSGNDPNPITVNIEGGYELRATVVNASAETDISINATE